ncbi:hypothetical protein KC19_VG089200, partial [Ceratodon purpureus]
LSPAKALRSPLQLTVLHEADVLGVDAEALAAGVDAVLADHSARVAAHPAGARPGAVDLGVRVPDRFVTHGGQTPSVRDDGAVRAAAATPRSVERRKYQALTLACMGFTTRNATKTTVEIFAPGNKVVGLDFGSLWVFGVLKVVSFVDGFVSLGNGMVWVLCRSRISMQWRWSICA